MRQKSLLLRAAFLGAVMLIAAGIILPLGWAVSGNRTGLLAGAAASGVCLLAAWTALCLGEPLRKPQHLVALVVAGTLVRMGIPLVAALAVFFRRGPLADAGFLYYLILFYPVTLTAETFLSLPERKNAPSAQDIVG